MRAADREHWKIVTMTGHRNVTPKDIAVIRGSIRSLVRNPSIDAIYFGGALGADTVALIAAAEFRQDERPHLVVVTPNTARHQPADARKYFHLADEVIELGYEITRDDHYAAFKKRNCYMVDVATAVVAFFSGNKKSGTWHAMSYAESSGLTVYPIPVESF